MILPEKFCDNMKSLLNDEYDDFIKSYFDEPLSGLRVNTSKISVEEFIKIAPFKLEKIPFISNGFYINENDGWSKHPFYYAGLYYLQEPSAMLPANRLKVKKTDKVLDLCAAPGGKATELASKCDLLVANDISFTRTIPLVKNLEMSGAKKLYVTNEEPQKLALIYRNYFDCILLDVPCSGEGMFRKDSGLIKAWINKGPEEYVDVQKSILEAAYEMLKSDGMILYSTCTFSPLETEEIIAQFISKHLDIKLLEIEPVEGALCGYDNYVKENEELKKCYHILPHRCKGEGHFLALMQKNQENQEISQTTYKASNNSKKNKKLAFEKLPDKVKEFLDGFDNECKSVIRESSYILDEKGYIYMLPLGFEDDYYSGIHYVRTGTLVGVWDKKGKFKPHTAFALYVDNSAYNNVCNFDSDDPLIIKYLKGETLILEDDIINKNGISKGYCIISVDGYNLGFAKFDGVKLKNLYETGWRMI